MDPRFQVKQYVAVVRNQFGVRFRVFKTGDDKWYLFDPLDAYDCSVSMQFPVLKSRLRNDLRRALANGCGNSL